MKKLLLSVAAAVMTVLGLGCVATMSPAYAAPIKCKVTAEAGITRAGSKLAKGKTFTLEESETVCPVGSEAVTGGSGGSSTIQETITGITPEGMPGTEDAETGLTDMITQVINVILMIVGIVAVVMMIVGGISFITSEVDAGKVAKARNTILYGVVGLIVAVLAFAIVNFVLAKLFSN